MLAAIFDEDYRVNDSKTFKITADPKKIAEAEEVIFLESEKKGLSAYNELGDLLREKYEKEDMPEGMEIVVGDGDRWFVNLLPVCDSVLTAWKHVTKLDSIKMSGETRSYCAELYENEWEECAFIFNGLNLSSIAVRCRYKHVPLKDNKVLLSWDRRIEVWDEKDWKRLVARVKRIKQNGPRAVDVRAIYSAMRTAVNRHLKEHERLAGINVGLCSPNSAKVKFIAATVSLWELNKILRLKVDWFLFIPGKKHHYDYANDQYRMLINGLRSMVRVKFADEKYAKVIRSMIRLMKKLPEEAIESSNEHDEG